MAPKTFKEIYQSQSAQRKLDRELQKQKDREFAEKHPILTIVTSLLSLSLSGCFFTWYWINLRLVATYWIRNQIRDVKVPTQLEPPGMKIVFLMGDI